jgi:hypothetical protein
MNFEFSFNLLTPENFRLLSEGRSVRVTNRSFFFFFLEAERSPVEHLRKEELINCKCGYMEEDGLMIQVMYNCSVGNLVVSMCILNHGF